MIATASGTSATALPLLSGTAEPGGTVTLYDGATLLGTATADNTGAWQFTPAAPLAEGPHSFTARTVGSAGIQGPASEPCDLNVVVSAWINLGAGLNNTAYALAATPDGGLYAGGAFTLAGVTNANRVAFWDGATWAPLGAGMNGGVYALALAPDGTLYAGGAFTTAGGVTANRIARWNGTTWAPLGTGLGGPVYALTIGPDGALYAAGAFTSAGGVTANRVARWNGTVWSALGQGVGGPDVSALVFDAAGALYAGGTFTTAGGASANRVARWADGAWTALDTGLNDRVERLAVGTDGALYAGGGFTTAGGVAAPGVARWDGTVWSSLGAGLTGHITALAAGPGGRVFAASAGRVCFWDGSAWSRIDTGSGTLIAALAVGASDRLYAGGGIATLGGRTVNNVASTALAPVPVLSRSSATTVTGPFEVAVAFSSAVSGLTTADFVVTNGTATGLTGSGANYVVMIAPAPGADATITIALPAAAGFSRHRPIHRRRRAALVPLPRKGFHLRDLGGGQLHRHRPRQRCDQRGRCRPRRRRPHQPGALRLRPARPRPGERCDHHHLRRQHHARNDYPVLHPARPSRRHPSTPLRPARIWCTGQDRPPTRPSWAPPSSPSRWMSPQAPSATSCACRLSPSREHFRRVTLLHHVVQHSSIRIQRTAPILRSCTSPPDSPPYVPSAPSPQHSS
ncbi:MAG: hypothetical protein IPL39_21505 [Opitutaceae bacterium]|nr:hypothetical protein [Opitutaceae bacterium]